MARLYARGDISLARLGAVLIALDIVHRFVLSKSAVKDGAAGDKIPVIVPECRTSLPTALALERTVECPHPPTHQMGLRTIWSFARLVLQIQLGRVPAKTHLIGCRTDAVNRQAKPSGRDNLVNRKATTVTGTTCPPARMRATTSTYCLCTRRVLPSVCRYSMPPIIERMFACCKANRLWFWSVVVIARVRMAC